MLPDDLGDKREDYPLTCFMVAGTQSERGKTNHVIVMKLSNLHRDRKSEKEKEGDEDDVSSSESEDEDEKPELETAVLTHSSGCVNRIRVSDLRTCLLIIK